MDGTTLKRLGTISKDRDNNLNLIRALAATMVLVSHAHPLAHGPGAIEPLQAELGHTLGTLSVFAFFVISGFLIPRSFDNSSSHVSFLVARALRLFPALLVSLVLVALVMGPIATELSLTAYLTHPKTLTFVPLNTTLVNLQYTLPGVFETNPYPTVTGSIWTLYYEVLCYMGLFLAGVIGMMRRKWLMGLAIFCLLVAWTAIVWLEPPIHNRIYLTIKLAVPFAVGTAFYLWRDRLPISSVIVAALVALTWILRDTPIYDVALIVTIGYGIFWLAYVPGGMIRSYNRLGDYSYGIYIYAFPIQGFAAWAYGPMTPAMNVLLALPATVAISVLSWHMIEEPSLRSRRWLSARLTGQRQAKTGRV